MLHRNAVCFVFYKNNDINCGEENVSFLGFLLLLKIGRRCNHTEKKEGY
jgi:hypothetical protein